MEQIGNRMQSKSILSCILLGVFVLSELACSSPRSSRMGRFSSERKGYFDRNSFRSENLEDFQWPVREVQITSVFGRRGKAYHEGIDLRAACGTPVYAAQSGVVLYAGTRIRGYGKLVVIRHRGKVATIYAHNSKTLVQPGQHVTKGQQVAVSGKTGHVTGPHVHFEIRRGVSAVNPILYLPRLERRLGMNAILPPEKWTAANQ